MNFSNTSPSHGLQLFTNCPSVGPSHGLQSFRNRLLQCGSPRGHKSCQQTCSGVGSSFHVSPGPDRHLLQRGLCTGSQLPSDIRLLWHGVPSTGCRSTVDLHGLQGNNLPHHGLHHKLQGKILCSGIWSTSSPSFFTDLGVCRVVSFTSSHSSLLNCHFPTELFFLPFLKYVITEVLPPLLIGLALASSRSVLELAGTGFIRHGGSFSQLLTEATPAVPLLPKPCHANP